MKFSEYINTHHVFATADLMSAMDSQSAAEEQLRLAVRSGAVERARRGLLVSNHGRFENSAVAPFEVVLALDGNAILSYHSALEEHGVAHSTGFVCSFRSNLIGSGFSFRGVDYKPCGPVDGVRARPMGGVSGRYLVTTREQTVVDCLGKPALAGGVEEVVRSLTAFVYVDVDELVEMAIGDGPSMASRVGWLLSEKKSEWHVRDEALEALKGALGSGPYRLGRAVGQVSGWSARWKLILPDGSEEVESWITRL